MRARAKQAGLAFISLIVVALAIAGSQGLLKRVAGDYGAFVLAAIVLVGLGCQRSSLKGESRQRSHPGARFHGCSQASCSAYCFSRR